MAFEIFRESEREGWHTRAGGYDGATARGTSQSVPTLLAHARVFPDARVLDAGCGPGYVAACATILGAQAEGVDFAPGMVDQAQVSYPDLRFQVADVEALPHPDQSFDAVISNMVLFHVTDPQTAMNEAFRVLSPNGCFAFSQWLGPDKSECYKMIFEVLSEHADMSLADPAPNAYALSDEDGVRQMMQSAGFQNVRFEVVENDLHATGDSFFDFFMTFGVRVPLILERQSVDVRAKVRAEIDAKAQKYRTENGYRIPMPSLVVSGQRALN